MSGTCHPPARLHRLHLQVGVRNEPHALALHGALVALRGLPQAEGGGAALALDSLLLLLGLWLWLRLQGCWFARGLVPRCRPPQQAGCEPVNCLLLRLRLQIKGGGVGLGGPTAR